ncbi:hypothetical protein SAMN05216355_101215 [Actinomyces ruminicola]|uniref:Uncharacterized protein n=1 Tax=Actinomyces ruminicola TaxID=332524 RepID=A0A1G9ZH97_9ACTO|nr:hypothetical protein [Actinomyces ruminicola]SDN20822.1 hypothetical protein SAMN05216355_101215 [Actinomyces ruminicola]
MNTTILRPAPVLRRGAVALLALGLALPGIAACNDEVPVVTAPETEHSKAADADSSPSPDPTSSADADTPTTGLSPLTRESQAPVDDDAVGAGAAYWDFPTSASGWWVYTLDDDGINELYNADSCTYTSAEYYYDGGSDWGDQDETEYQADRWVEFLEDEHGTVTATQEVSTSVTDSEGDPVEMIMVDSQYNEDDGDAVRNISWLRVFSSADDYTMLMLSYTCGVDDVDQTDLSRLVSRTHIVNPGPAKMEDGAPGKSSGGSSTGNDDMV